MEELYAHIFDLDGVVQKPPYHGFSYGLLLAEDDRPVACFYLDEEADRKAQYILSNGLMQIYSMGSHRAQIYYGYVTDGERFFCEEQVYPRQNENEKEGGFL